MKVVLAGAFGHLGSDCLRALVKSGHEVTAFGRTIRKPEDLQEGYKALAADVTDQVSLKGICDGADVVISTVGLTSAAYGQSYYDVDYRGNLNLLIEAKKAGVKHFAYISVIKADSAPTVPMLNAKNRFEISLMNSGLNWVIFRPTGYFYDIAKVFMPMVDKGKVTLLGKGDVHANVVDTPDFADFIVSHMCDTNKVYNVGGKETYSYEEMAGMFFNAAGKPAVIKRAPAAVFDGLILANKIKKTGKADVIKFSKWTLTEEMVGDTIVGDASFAQYIKDCYKDHPAEKPRRMMKRAFIDAKETYKLKKVQAGEFAIIKSKGMTFTTRVFDAKGAGRLFLMDMKAFGGLMKMETVTFTPTELDGPILSTDIVHAFGRSTLVLELYGPTIGSPDFGALDEVKKRYGSLPVYDPGTHPYDDFRLPQSVYKKGRGIKEETVSMAAEYIDTYFEALKNCEKADPEEKKKKNAEFTGCLFEAGGMAVDQFKKMVGEEKTREFLFKYMFHSL
ncbi:MAG: SDR family oxidoreductase [Lachnospiraceae bacterium]|nr:SDR family oxidoreductase [Lachnospiraceae bacterium]